MRYFKYVMLVIACLMGGCRDELGVTPIPSPETAFWELRLNHHAILLSLRPPHNTLQLFATPYFSNGEVWTQSDTSQTVSDSILMASPTEFVSRDSTKILVSKDGVVTARAVQAANVFVVATRKLDGIVHADSALVRVADVVSPPVLDTFFVRPRAGDSAKSAVVLLGVSSKTLVVTTRNSTGGIITNIPIYFTSSNPRVALVANKWTASKMVSMVRPGEVILRAETWVYGVAKLDTFMFTVGYPVNFGFAGGLVIDPTGNPAPREHHIGPGAILSFANKTGRTTSDATAFGGIGFNGKPIDIIFDDPANVLPAIDNAQSNDGGNIPGIPGDTTLMAPDERRFRRFLRPGTYTYRVLPFNTSGRIIVHDK